jgi:type IV pilus assembly protein PilB
MSAAQMGEVLMRAGLLEERQVRAALARHQHEGGHFASIINELGYATEPAIARALSVEMHLPRFDMAQLKPEPEAIATIDAHSAQDLLALPVAVRDGGQTLWVAMADPTDDEVMKFLQRKTGKRVRPMVSAPNELRGIIRRLYGIHEERRQEMELDITASDVPDAIPSPQAVFSEEDLARMEQVRATLNKSALALRAVVRLCVEKGVVDAAEVKSRLKG